jgi:hypothetical protein
MKKNALKFFLLLLCVCSVASAGEASIEDDPLGIMARVAAYVKCADRLRAAGSREEKERLRVELKELREELVSSNIDYRSFIGVHGRTEDIFGAWFFDGTWISNSVYREFFDLFDLPSHLRKMARRPQRAVDVGPEGGVPDSAFFINGDIGSITPEEMEAHDELVRPRGAMKITGAKQEGQSEGFYGVDDRGWKYIVIVDPPGMEEQVTGAEVVGSTLVRMAGYNVPSSAIVRISGTGSPEFDGRRGVATRLIPGYRGHWSYGAFRNRREIRATRVFAAWIHNTDWVDHNTGISVMEVDGVELTRYFIFDFGGSLGSWNIRAKEPRDGWENYVDFGEIFLWPVLCPLRKAGALHRPYPSPGPAFSEAVGYFDDNVCPDRYRANYPNRAWRKMTEGDARWAASLIARFSDRQIHKAVELARYSRQEDAERIYEVLISRRDKILNYYRAVKR